MGIDIQRKEFDDEDYRRFNARLENQLDALGQLLSTPGFGVGDSSIGCELELYIVDPTGRPAFLNELLLKAASDPQLTLELDRYNLEFNLSHGRLCDGILRATEDEIVRKVATLTKVASDFQADVVPIGILPTLTTADFGAHSMTDRMRYHALRDQLVQRRGKEFEIEINGEDPLVTTLGDITLEGANTSFQMHWRVNPDDFAATFNALQLVTPLVLALSTNSPGIFGHFLWEETRIPLFKQSIDTRVADRHAWREPARVSYGQGWVRHGVLELFESAVRLFPPLLPVLADDTDSPEASLSTTSADDQRRAACPALAELRLHQGTVWQWNRPVFDPINGGHVRIELRALPAGPSAIDMVASMALALGLTVSLREEIDRLLPALPFSQVERNFYRAAEQGLSADLVWPTSDQHQLSARPARDLLIELLPLAEHGLRALGVPINERDRYLSVIERRLNTSMTGARWQRAIVSKRESSGQGRFEALASMLADYRRFSRENLAVSEWPL